MTFTIAIPIHNKDNGVFVDIGAHNGITFSNTAFLEKERGWKGLCVEPCPNNFEELIENRGCKCLNCAISDHEGEEEFTYITGAPNMLSGLSADYHPDQLKRIDRELKNDGGVKRHFMVQTRPLQAIFDELGLLDIDYCSIDTEGSELKIVKSIDFSKTNIKLLTIENNYGDNGVREYLESLGYEMVNEGYDEVYIK